MTAIDVVVVTYNSSAHLLAALDSLPESAAVVVVDNASDDDSVACARHAGATVIASAVNAGFAAAANRGARVGTSELHPLLQPGCGARGRAARRAGRTRSTPLPRWPSCRPVARTRRAGAAGALAVPVGARRVARRVRPGLDRRPARSPRRGPSGVGRRLRRRRLLLGPAGRLRGRGRLRRAVLAVRRGDRPLPALGRGRLVALEWSTRPRPPTSAEPARTASRTLVFEHFQRGAEHFVSKYEGRKGLRSLRLAEALGSSVRALASSDPRAAALSPSPPGPPGARARSSHPMASSSTARPRRSAAPASSWLRSRRGTTCGAATSSSCASCSSIEPRSPGALRRARASTSSTSVRHPTRPPTSSRPAPGRRLRPGLPVRARQGAGPAVLGPLADRSLRRQVRRAAAALGFDDPDSLDQRPELRRSGLGHRLARALRHHRRLDRGGRSGPRAPAGSAQRAAAVRPSAGRSSSAPRASPPLAAGRRPDLVVVPNAVDAEHFTRPAPALTTCRAAPTAVYVGTLHDDRLDVDLVVDAGRSAARAHDRARRPDSLSPTSRAPPGVASQRRARRTASLRPGPGLPAARRPS